VSRFCVYFSFFILDCSPFCHTMLHHGSCPLARSWESPEPCGSPGNCCRVKVGGVGVEGIMLGWRWKSWSTSIILEDRIACMLLPLPTSDLEVPTTTTARCGPICIVEGRSFIWRTPRRSQASLKHRLGFNAPLTTHRLREQTLQRDCSKYRRPSKRKRRVSSAAPH